MSVVRFTPNLARHVACPPVDANGATLGEILADAFAQSPAARDYVLDEQGALRKHIAVFIDGEHADVLTSPVKDGAEIWIMQALSGG